MLTPKALDLTPPAHNQYLEWNDMHNLKGLMMMIQRGG
jgi:hypothetical protein